MPSDIELKEAVRSRYARTATTASSCCAPSGSSSCCSEPSTSRAIGYSADDLAGIPEGADLGLGCGNPLAMLGLQEGETVIDLGSGAGIDCFIAAKRVGPSGRVIGVDMTPEMIAKARRNAAQAGVTNVEFRLGEIEHLPVADGEADAIVSNCVINLVPDKGQVFADAFRALKPGGRLSVSDIVLLGEMPEQLVASVEAYVACVAGAIKLDQYLSLVSAAGFTDVAVTSEQRFSGDEVLGQDLTREYMAHSDVSEAEVRAAAENFASVRVEARKPA